MSTALRGVFGCPNPDYIQAWAIARYHDGVLCRQPRCRTCENLMKSTAVVSLVCVLLAGAAPLNLTTAHTFTADLDPGHQVPPLTGVPGFGQCTTYPINSTTWGYKVNVVDVPDLTEAHFHQGKAGTNGPVVTPLVAQTVPITVEGSALFTGTFTPKVFQGPLAGKTFADLTTAIHQNDIYCNVHNKEYPEGIIRGQVA